MLFRSDRDDISSFSRSYIRRRGYGGNRGVKVAIVTSILILCTYPHKKVHARAMIRNGAARRGEAGQATLAPFCVDASVISGSPADELYVAHIRKLI